MEIMQFVRLAEIDPVYFEASNYMRPAEAGRKPCALLDEAMPEVGIAAVAQFAMYRRDPAYGRLCCSSASKPRSRKGTDFRRLHMLRTKADSDHSRGDPTQKRPAAQQLQRPGER
jgi:hypothetical protein